MWCAVSSYLLGKSDIEEIREVEGPIAYEKLREICIISGKRCSKKPKTDVTLRSFAKSDRKFQLLGHKLFKGFAGSQQKQIRLVDRLQYSPCGSGRESDFRDLLPSMSLKIPASIQNKTKINITQHQDLPTSSKLSLRIVHTQLFTYPHSYLQYLIPPKCLVQSDHWQSSTPTRRVSQPPNMQRSRLAHLRISTNRIGRRKRMSSGGNGAGMI